MNHDKDALDYHASGRPGKIEVIPSKPTSTQRDLSLAYSPGVAVPCKEIEKDRDKVYKYTAKGNLVAVISNGTAVLGLGNIGAEASKPVMEGKGLLFKILADIDVFDIEIDQNNVEDFVKTVKAISPTFGGINLEDIKAPECFEIEKRLKNELKIPVMHDDQHGTAIISAAALLNALDLAEKEIDQVQIVVNGAGASAISCTRLYLSLGAKPENIVMVDSTGVIRKDRENLDSNKAQFATSRDLHSLSDAVQGSDVFIGLSRKDVFTPEMLKTMAANPIVFALANPDPEIAYELAVATREDLIIATGRSDYPNQVNNAIGFPYIFRGALDVRATQINEAMKLAAVKAIAELAKQAVPEIVNMAYNQRNIIFGRDYIIPKPLDTRLIYTVAPAVAKAAIESGVAQRIITKWDTYEEELKKRLGLDEKLIRVITNKAKQNPQRVVFAEADNYKILKAAQIVKDEGIAIPILLGNNEKIQQLIKENNIDLDNVTIIDPRQETETTQLFGELFFQKRHRRGFNLHEAKKVIMERNYYGAMMVETGQADALISGLTRNYADTLRPALRIIGKQKEVSKVAGMYILLTKKGPVFFADTTINVNPGTKELVDITIMVAKTVQQFNMRPKIALLSFSNFGSSEDPASVKVRRAVEYLHDQYPSLLVDGEMQANLAFNTQLLRDNYPFSELIEGGANTLIFPSLDAGNIAYKLLMELGGAEAIGPVLLGMNKPVHILQLGSPVRDIVNMITIAVVDAQSRKGPSVPNRLVTA
ncbi:MAG: NADP-dependent malic enzyme [Bacteroidia bacterium]|nr:NADP-dependent malic enzyme [Bacteroidia bacterium]